MAGLLLGVLMTAPLAAAQETAASATNFATLARQTYLSSQEQYQRASTNATLAWQYGRACFDLADLATNDTQRAAWAQEGIAACRQAIRLAPKLAPAPYYLAMNLGQLARTQTLGALGTVKEMEQTFKTARQLDPAFDYAGADRGLGLLYRDAPGWPLSVGSDKKARKHLQRAVELSPDYPENRLNLLETCLKWNDRKGVKQETQALTALLPVARTNFTGVGWASAWADWEKRWRQVLSQAGQRKELEPNKPDKAAPAPRSAAAQPPAPPKPRYPIVTQVDVVAGTVVWVNAKLRFVVADFALNPLPALDQRLGVYRQRQKVGQLKVTGPVRESTVVADILTGDVRVGDQVRQD
jgi:tetratricopeptide (TPR) repeat protein